MKGYLPMDRYTYFGPVLVFGTVVENNYTATTYASSEKKAKSNIAFQFKKSTGKLPGAKVELPGKLYLEVS